MEKIVLWEPDQDLRKALSLLIDSMGYKTVAISRLCDFKDVVELERPLACLMPEESTKGERVTFGRISGMPDVRGVMSVVVPEYDEEDPDGESSTGVVLDNIRKPFGVRELSSCLEGAMGRKVQLESAPFPWEQSLEVRALQSTDELIEALELRYEVYREVGYMETSEYGLDLDPYDFKSTIFGAFINDGERSELAGAIRIIQDTGFGPHRAQVAEVMARYGIDPASAEVGAMGGTLPALETFRLDIHDCRRFYTGFATETSCSSMPVSSSVHELSRLVISRKHRRNRAGLERRLYEMVIAHCCAARPRRNWFVIAVHPSKTRKYIRFGFQNITQLGIQDYTGIDQPAALMVWDLHRYLQLPNPFNAELEDNIVEYAYRDSLVSTFTDRRVRVAAGDDTDDNKELESAEAMV